MVKIRETPIKMIWGLKNPNFWKHPFCWLKQTSLDTMVLMGSLREEIPVQNHTLSYIPSMGLVYLPTFT